MNVFNRTPKNPKKLVVLQRQNPNGQAEIKGVESIKIEDGFLYGYDACGKIVAVVPAADVAIASVEDDVVDAPKASSHQ